MDISNLFLGIAIFIASAVEAIEALTIILALAVSRGWRSVRYAIAAGLLSLVAIVAVTGYTLLLIPIYYAWLFIGGILLIFGVQWMQKATLRYVGLKPIRDEEEVYNRELKAANKSGKKHKYSLDWYAFVIVYKTILLEGLEVVFIVLAFASIRQDIWFGSLVALAAVIFIALIGVFIHKPLAKVPENTMKFAVGVLLASFGTVFAAKGAGIGWLNEYGSPNEYAAFAYLVALYLAAALFQMHTIKPGDKKVKRPSKSFTTKIIIVIILSSLFGVFLSITLWNNPLLFDVSWVDTTISEVVV